MTAENPSPKATSVGFGGADARDRRVYQKQEEPSGTIAFREASLSRTGWEAPGASGAPRKGSPQERGDGCG